MFFLNRKFHFYLPSKNKILFYDSSKSKGQMEALGINEKNAFLFCLQTDLWFFNLCHSVLSTLFSRNLSVEKFKDNYVKSILKSVRPNLVLTTIDNETRFWNLKKDFEKITFIVIQNALRGLSGQSSLRGLSGVWAAKPQESSQKKHLCVDKLFVMNETELDWYDNRDLRYKSWISIGSIKNNFVQEIKNKRQASKRKEIVFLLQFKDFPFDVDKSKTSTYYKFNSSKTLLTYYEIYFPSIKIIKKLQHICSDNKFQLIIYGRAKNEQEANREIKFLNYFLKNNKFVYKYESDIFGAYKYLQKADCIITLSSTLGNEMLGRGKKVLFIGVRQDIFGDCEIFAYGKYGLSGPFWTTSIDNQVLSKKIINLINLSKSEWINILKSYKNHIIPYKFDNLEIKNFLNRYR